MLHDETGTLSFAGDPQSLAWAILKVIREPGRARELGEKAKRRLVEEFGWEGIADQTKAVYERVWAEYLESYWAADTPWPVSPGAEERAKALNLEGKATEGVTIPLSRPSLTPGVPFRQAIDEEEEGMETLV